MPSDDTPEVIVARWLRQNSYEKTLNSFLEEAGLPEDAGSVSGKALSLEQLLEEKRLYDQSLVYEKRTEPTEDIWTLPAPSVPQILDIPQPANILHVSVDHVTVSDNTEQRLAITMADRRLIETATEFHVKGLLAPPDSVEQVLTQDSPILSWTRVSEHNTVQHIGTTMSGKVFIHSHDNSLPLLERTDHRRYCIKAAVTEFNSSQQLLATIGWDSVLNVYTLSPSSAGIIKSLGPPSSTLTLSTIPEDIIWISNPYKTSASDIVNSNILILTRRDSCLLHYYLPTTPTPTLLGTQNLAPHAISWTVFTPSSIALCPTDPTVLAVATSSLPHLKLILVRLLIPDTIKSTANSIQQPASHIDHVNAPQSALAAANEAEAAIMHHISTLAPQTAYSTPRVVWRPDGSGVWVNGDDGAVRGIETTSGKIVAVLKGESGSGHEPGAKVRTLWAGYVQAKDGSTREEWVVSGGFDRRVVIWRVPID